MDPGEQITGTRDEQYDLISVLYHALHGAENCEMYAVDAEAAGETDLADFFREAQERQTRLAERAKGLLGILEVPPEPEVAPDLPPEGGLTPGDMAGGIPPGPVDVEPGRATSPRGDTVPAGAPPGTFGGVTPEDEVATPTTPRDVSSRPANIGREPGIRSEEPGRPVGEVPPTTDVPRTSAGAFSPETGVSPGLPPEDLQRATSSGPASRDEPSGGLVDEAAAARPAGSEPDVPPPHIPVASPPREDADSEPGRATLEQPGARQTEQKEEDKGLLDKAKDTLKEARDRLAGQ
jgi:hypothetical protein